MLGAYISQDPIGLAGGIHPYRYPHNPNTWIDPLGLANGPAIGWIHGSESSTTVAGGGGAPTQDAAAIRALGEINPTSVANDQEYGGMICKARDGTYSATPPLSGGDKTVDPGGPGACPRGTRATAYYHSHGAARKGLRSEDFSSYDKIYAIDFGVDGYLATPSGAVKRYSQSTGSNVTIGSVPTTK